jgi:catechol 2,3-dioxygenase-like lactoylglutathione lyase family enzyme
MTSAPVLDLKAFVPAKDLDVSRQFYRELGFIEKWANADIAEFQAGEFRFLLQRFHAAGHAENFMMHLMVEDADAWWQRISEARLLEKYGLHMARPPRIQPWGLRVLYLSDPSGVLWHIADTRSGDARG